MQIPGIITFRQLFYPPLASEGARVTPHSSKRRTPGLIRTCVPVMITDFSPHAAACNSR